MEGIGLVCTVLFLPCLLLMTAIFLIGGGIGTITTWRKKEVRLALIVALILGLGLTVWISRIFGPREFWLSLRPGYHLGDNQLAPYEHAITDFDRVALGFTAVPEDAEIKIIDNDEGFVSCPDVELYIPDLPFKRQHICLRKVDDEYVWHSEYEVYLGPERYQTIWLAYSSASHTLGGVDNAPYTLVIEYRAPGGPELLDGDLSLEDVQPIIAAWESYHLSHP